MLPPEDREPRKLAQLIKEQTARLMPEQPERLRSCGISVSGRMDAEHGIVGASKAFGWSNLDLATPLSEVLGMPVQVENDVRACLTWEATRLGIKDAMKDAAYLYLGRAGIGFGCMVGGQVVRGLNNAAGEIEDVYLGLNDCLYEHLMEISMVERARRFSPTVSSIGDILKANRMGLTWARLLVDDFVSHLSIVLQLVRAILDPDLHHPGRRHDRRAAHRAGAAARRRLHLRRALRGRLRPGRGDHRAERRAAPAHRRGHGRRTELKYNCTN